MHVYGHSLPVAGIITGIGFPGVSWSFLDIHARLWSFITSCWIYHWNRLSRRFMDFLARLWSFITSCWIYHWNRLSRRSWTFLHVCGNSLPVAGFITGIGLPGVSWSFVDIHARLWSFITSCWLYHWNRFHGLSLIFMHVYGHSLPVAGFITGIGFPGVSWTFLHVYGHSLPVAGFITGIGFPGVSWTFLHVCGNSLPVAGFITGIGFPGVSWTFV